jgi:hypothetical protein
MSIINQPRKMQLRALLVGLTLGTVGAVLVQRLLRPKDVAEPAQSTVPRTPMAERPNAELRASDDLSRLTAAELYRRAQAVGIAGRSNMTKAQLIEALRGTQA